MLKNHRAIDLISKVAPSFVASVRAVRNRRYFRRRFQEFQKGVKSMLYADNELIVVQTGPFEGMRYLNAIVWGSITPKWLGSYECELHEVIREIVGSGYNHIVDVGAAEGYYAVGLAYKIANAAISAHDTDFISRRQQRELATLNSVESRVKINGFCSHECLNAKLKDRSLLICDIEGGESELLDPIAAVGLKQADILVELHETEQSANTIEHLIKRRFSHTHDIVTIHSTPRTVWLQMQGNRFQQIPAGTMIDAVDEGRPFSQNWLWMKSKVPA